MTSIHVASKDCIDFTRTDRFLRPAPSVAPVLRSLERLVLDAVEFDIAMCGRSHKVPLAFQEYGSPETASLQLAIGTVTRDDGGMVGLARFLSRGPGRLSTRRSRTLS